jgi:hypothetical protein
VCTGFQWGNLREGDHLEDGSIDGRMILDWILGTGGGFCEHSDEPSSSIKYKEFLH